MVPKHKGRDAANLEMPKKSHRVLPLSIHVKGLALIRKGKHLYVKGAKIYDKDKSSFH